MRPEDYQTPVFLAISYVGLGLGNKALAITERGIELIEKHLLLHPDDTRAINLGATSLSRLG